jgi:hypothetical protein
VPDGRGVQFANQSQIEQPAGMPPNGNSPHTRHYHAFLHRRTALRPVFKAIGSGRGISPQLHSVRRIATNELRVDLERIMSVAMPLGFFRCRCERVQRQLPQQIPPQAPLHVRQPVGRICDPLKNHALRWPFHFPPRDPIFRNNPDVTCGKDQSFAAPARSVLYNLPKRCHEYLV